MAVFSFLTITAALAVNISRFVKALSELRRHDTNGIRLEITAPGCQSSARKGFKLDRTDRVSFFYLLQANPAKRSFFDGLASP